MRVTLATGILALLLAVGCDSAFDPIANGNKHFALYSVLDGRTTEQLIRVEDLAGSLNVPDQLDARVTLQDVDSGDIAEGRDSLVILNDSSRGHIFVVPMSVQPGRTYLLEAARQSNPEAISSAEVMVPEPWPADTTAADSTNGIWTQSVLLTGGSGPLDGAPEVVYDLRNLQTGAPHRIAFDYLFTSRINGFALFVVLSEDIHVIRETLGIEPDDNNTLALERIAVHYTRPFLQGVPVERGFGQVGWVVPFESPWVLEPEALEDLGLVDAQDPGGAP